MASAPKSRFLISLLWLCAGVPVWQAAAQVPLTLADLNARKLPDYSPLHAGQLVQVQGIVSAEAFRFPNYNMLAIQDGEHGGAIETLDADGASLNGCHPGDEIQATGRVTSLAGMVLVQAERIVIVGHHPPPEAVSVSFAGLADYGGLGRRVRIEGRIEQFGETMAGPYVYLGKGNEHVRVFLPTPRERQVSLQGMSVGDIVEATGVAHQYAPRSPFNYGFELLTGDPPRVIRAGQSWFLPPAALVGGAALMIIGVLFLWRHEHRMRNQRERLRKTYQLGEEIVGASSPDVILKRISDSLPAVLGVTRVHLYVFNRAAKTLDTTAADTGEPVSISLSNPPSGPEAGAVACFHYRTLLAIPDIERSPFPIAGEGREKTPKSLLFVPMMAQGEVAGVLQFDQDDRARDFPRDEQSMAQHLANQIGVALRLLDQRSVQEQLFRTEKLAAVGRLITGIVNELQTPLSSISNLATRGLERLSTGTPERELSAIAAEAQKAVSMVARLVSFAANDHVEARHVSITALLRSLVEFREGDWRASGIRVHDLCAREPLSVMGSQGQLEQVFLNLLVHAEQSLADSPRKEITLRTTVLARRLLVEIAFSAPHIGATAEETAAVLGVTRSVIAGHGGEVRLIDKRETDPRFEVELPLAVKERLAGAMASVAGSPDGSRRSTALVIEPEDTAQRQLLSLLATRGFRVVPVDNADAGLELSQRLRFDAVFCSIHAPGLNWVELSERMHSRIGAFILLADGYDPELSADFEGQGRFVLPKPFQENELASILKSFEKAPLAKVIPIKNGVA
jgi:GAF domain-containing protein/CheY-like chemotaxis protein